MTQQDEKKPRRSRGEGGVAWNSTRQRFVAHRVVGYSDRGKQIRKSASGRSRSEALENLRRVIRDYEKGVAPGADKVTVSGAVKDWLLYGQGEADGQTVRTREYNSAHIIAGIGDVLLRKLTAKHVEKLLAHQATTRDGASS